MSAGPLNIAGDDPRWLAARDPRLRILAALLFALVTVSLQQLDSALIALGGAATMAVAAGVAWQLPRRLLALEAFMLVMLLVLPFSVPGRPWWELGPLVASHEGLLRATLILVKANAVVIALLALLGTLEAVTLGHALGRLRVPAKLVHLYLFTVRYIDLLHAESLRLRRAMRARAFVARSELHSWRSLGWLVGMLLVRSLERSRRILAAMKCRGFDGRLYLLDDYRWRGHDSLAALLLCGLLCALLLRDRLA